MSVENQSYPDSVRIGVKRYGTVSADKQKEMSGLEFVQGLDVAVIQIWPHNLAALTRAGRESRCWAREGVAHFGVPGAARAFEHDSAERPRDRVSQHSRVPTARAGDVIDRIAESASSATKP